MLVANIESIFLSNLTQDSVNDIKKLFVIKTISPNQKNLHQSNIETEIPQEINHTVYHKIKNKNLRLKKINTVDIKPYFIQQQTPISQCRGLKIDSCTLRGSYTKQIYLQKMNLMKSKLPNICRTNTSTSKSENADSISSPLRFISQERKQSSIIQKQKLLQTRSSKKIFDNSLPSIQEKKLLPTNYSQTISPQKSLSIMLPVKGYLIHDLGCYFYFTSNIQNSKKISNVKKFLPPITARHYCILNTDNLEFMARKGNRNEQMQIASLSKIVTAFLTILICKKYLLDMSTFKCRVYEEAVQMPGTSAQLQVGDSVTIQNLLYALLLPSGNDAAVTLAQNLGRFLQKQKKKISKAAPSSTFIKHMNILYKEIILKEDQSQHIFQNPSGLPLNPNITTIEQISIISAIAMKNDIFKKIVSTQQYQLTLKNQRYGLTRKIIWKNTNKLLQKNWQGVKTGTTQTAGHCFIGKYKNYLISILDCGSLSKRFSEAMLLMKYLTDS